jgi:short subunit dehydrogenase-like uncharacterized protein
MTKLMIYGASGYTGRMAAEHAKAAGLDLVVAGRDAGKLAKIASDLSVEYRAFAVDDTQALDSALSDAVVLLNCAGPFGRTVRPLMTAAIRNGVHYLDVSAELDGYRLAQDLDGEARTAGVMLLPGSGGSVAMLGCLAAYAAERLPHPVKVSIALHVSGAMSRGSAISAMENLSPECLERVGHQLRLRDPGERKNFDFGAGARSCFPVTLPDLITIGHSTGCPDVETFVHVSGDAFPQGDLAAMPDGPTAAERERNRYQAAVEVVDRDGSTARAVLDTVNGYTFTPMAAAEAARRVLGGEVRSGFQTPVELFGKEFAETIADTKVMIL